MRCAHLTTACQAALFIASALAGVNACAQAQVSTAQQPPSSDASGVLLLKDGGVLEGNIRREGDWYIVSRGGGQMQVAPAHVTHVCQSIAEAYEYQRQQASPSSAAAHLALADWCMRYNLIAEAGRELAEARNLEPDHPRLALLERRLTK